MISSGTMSTAADEEGAHQRYTYDNTVAFTGFLRLYCIYIYAVHSAAIQTLFK